MEWEHIAAIILGLFGLIKYLFSSLTKLLKPFLDAVVSILKEDIQVKKETAQNLHNLNMAQQENTLAVRELATREKYIFSRLDESDTTIQTVLREMQGNIQSDIKGIKDDLKGIKKADY